MSHCKGILRRQRSWNAYIQKLSSRPAGKYTGAGWQKKKKKKNQNQELINTESKCLPLFSIFSFLFPSAVGHLGLPWWLSGKKSPCSVVDPDLIPESGRSPGEGNGNPLWNSCLGNSMNRGGYSPWVAKSQTRLSD